MENKKKLIILILITISSILLIVIFIFFLRKQSRGSIGDYPSVKKNTSETDLDLPVDFNELKMVNDEIYAWINIPGTNVDYPILQSREDNNYYLNKNVNKEKSSYGAIFTQFYNSTDFNDFNTVIYGHNMHDGTMFGGLERFKDKDFFEKNEYINIYLQNRVLKYRIFAAYTFGDKNINLSYNFSSKVDRQYYLDKIFSIADKDAVFRKSVNIDTNDRIITLSTCSKNIKYRFLVQGVLIFDSSIE